jgi:hypothetical protein
MDVSVDTAQLDALADRFARHGLSVGPKVAAVTAVAGRNTRDDARRFVQGMSHLPGYPRTITYELQVRGTQVVAEVGPEVGGQGSLGHIIEFGTATSPPHAHLGPAFDREVPGWLEHLQRIAGDV